GRGENRQEGREGGRAEWFCASLRTREGRRTFPSRAGRDAPIPNSFRPPALPVDSLKCIAGITGASRRPSPAGATRRGPRRFSCFDNSRRRRGENRREGREGGR